MKKILSTILTGAMLLSFAACTGAGGSTATQPAATDPTDPATEAQVTEAPTQEASTTPTTEAAPDTEAQTEAPDIDLGGDFITGPASLERLSALHPSTTLTVSDTPNVQKLDALGTEWDPHFFRSFNVSEGCDEAAWEMIVRRIQTLGLQKVRMMVLPGWYEPQNDNADPAQTDMSAFTFDSEAFRSLLRSLDVCEANHIKVNLTVWGVNLGVEPTMSWLAYSDCGDWISAPTDKQEFAENVSALLSYLLEEKKYTCVKEVTLYNEPDWAYKGAGGRVSFEDYAELCRTVHNRLVADGLRDKIKLILGDDTDTSGAAGVTATSWFARCVTTLTDIADGFDTHFYAFNNNTPYRMANAWAKQRNRFFQKHAPGLQYTHNEFGSNLADGAYCQKDIDTYERGLFLSKMAVAALNGGSAGMLYWVLHDERYNDYPSRKDSVMQLGLFGYADENWRIRPIYHAWGLIMNHTVPDSEIYGIGYSGDIAAVALKSPTDAWTYIVCNDGEEAQVVHINNSHLDGAQFQVYIYAQDTVTDSEAMIPSAGITYTEGADTYVYLPAHAFAVVSE